MENTVSNIAVISFPRTGSKSIVNWYANKLGKQPAHGVLHQPEYHGSNNYDVREIVFGLNHVLHGHWHSLPLLDEDVRNFVKTNYKIITCYRETSDVQASIERLTGRTDLFDDVVSKSLQEKANWDIWKQHVIKGDEVYTVDGPPPNYILA